MRIIDCLGYSFLGVKQHPTIAEGRKPKQYLTDAERLTIAAAAATGAVKGELAQRFNVRPETISRVLKLVKTLEEGENALSAGRWKNILRLKAIAGVTDGLDCGADPYKRANVSCRVLEGIGEFAVPGQSQVNVAIVSTTPAEWRARYLSVNDSKPDSTETSQHDISLIASKDGPTESFATQSDTPQIDTEKLT